MSQKRGVFSLKGHNLNQSTDNRSVIEKVLKENENKIRCNHIDASTGHSMLEPYNWNGNGEPTVFRCKHPECRAIIDASPQKVNAKAVQAAYDLIYSASAIIRHEMNISDTYDNRMVGMMTMLVQLPAIMTEFEQMHNKPVQNNNRRPNNPYGGYGRGGRI